MANLEQIIADIKELKLLEEERGIPQDEMIVMLETGLTAAYKKHLGEAKLAQVKLNPEKHTIKFYSGKQVVETVEDPDKEISLADAKEIKKSYKKSIPISCWENSNRCWWYCNRYCCIRMDYSSQKA